MIKGNFIDNLPKVYGIYTGGFIAFIIIMAIGEEANIKYNIEDSNDLDELDDEDYEEEFNNQVNEFRTVFEDIKKGTMKRKVEPEKIKSGVVPQNILDKVKEQGPEIRSLLSKGEE